MWNDAIATKQLFIGLYKNFQCFPWDSPFLLTNVGITVVPACMCRHIIEFSQAVYIIDPGFYLVWAGYQPAWATWYIALIPQALVLCLIYTHAPSGLRPWGLCVYIRKSTRACGISITYSSNTCKKGIFKNYFKIIVHDWLFVV